jgi:Tfp pilus assembly protein PilF
MCNRNRRSTALVVTLLMCTTGCVSIPALNIASNGERTPDPSQQSSVPGLNDLGESEPEEPVDPEQQQRSVLFAKARLLETDRQPQPAARLYKEVLQSDPKHAAALHRLAVVHAELGDIEAADDCFQKALRVDDQNAEVHNDYGYFCYLVRRWDDSESHLLRALELNPLLLAAHNNLGLLSAERGDLDLAVRHFRDAGCSPDDAQYNATLNRPSESSGTATID